MQLPPKNYDAMVKRANPPSPVVKDCLWAFFVGGAICLLGEALRQFYLSWYDKDLAGTLTSITLVMLSAITTVPGWYQKLAAKAGAVVRHEYQQGKGNVMRRMFREIDAEAYILSLIHI